MIRYLGEDDTGENLDVEELPLLRAAGLSVALVYQVGKGWQFEGVDVGGIYYGPGYERGWYAASVALWQGTALGLPADRPVYFSVDQDPRAFTEEQWAVLEDLFAGIKAVMGYERTGVYGGRTLIDRFVPDVCPFGWQAKGWSDGRVSPVANVYQYATNQSMCGGTVDFDLAATADFGQWA